MYSKAPLEVEENLRSAVERQFCGAKVIFISPIQSGPSSLAWKVEAEADGRRLFWCVKQHRGKTVERLRFESQFTRRMQSHCQLIPHPVATRSGCDWFHIGQELYSASELVFADPPYDWTAAAWSKEQCRAAGQALAEFHEGSSRLALEGGLPESDDQAVLVAVTESVRRSLARAAAHRQEALLSFAVERRERILQRLFDLLQTFPPDENPWIIVHGDYHPGNLLFSGDAVQAIVDMDYVHRDSPLYDVAYGALLFAGNWSTRTEPFLKTDLLESFLCGYNASTFGQRVRGDIFAYLQLSKFLVAYWLLDLYCDRADLRSAISVPLLNCLNEICKT